MRAFILASVLLAGGFIYAQTNTDSRVIKLLPGFRLETLDGTTLTQTNFTGRMVLVWFFLSDDKPSRRQLPVLLELQRDYGTNHIAVIGMCLDVHDRVSLKTVASRLEIPFPLVLMDMKFITDCGPIDAAPTTVVLDPRGVILNRHVGVTSRQALLADLRGTFDQPKE